MAVRYVAIHGHFYQPPRENPWLGIIEQQDSAFPQHDWNDRIAFQCYCPNARAKILDPQGKIETLVNNYIYMTFNFGPTLFSWLEIHHPKTYRRILDADRISQELNGGHGNAIAQVFNHMIMPLASREDKITQIRWGIEDFRSRFQRDPEGMWLAETAINQETVSILIDHKIKFTILSPTQAQRFTRLGKDEWADVGNNTINPRRPYRIFDVDKNGKKHFDRYLDVFFYDGPLSTAVSFEHLLRTAEGFGSRVDGAFDHGSSEPQIVNIATDGESYGHHEPFGEMGLAYLLSRIMKKRRIQVINHAYYLELHPPQHEVELKAGPNGEGTSWSCFHGVGRWYRHCGCTTGGESWWTQEWRTPLRNAFNELRFKLDKIFMQEGQVYFKNLWEARNDYVALILDPSPKSRETFIQKHCHNPGAIHAPERMWALLEMQRYGMYMYTSCGWFFADISGMEPVQNMCYAKRAIEFARLFTPDDLEDNMRSILKSARSNHPYIENGDVAYERYVLPQAYTEPKIVHTLVVLNEYGLDVRYPAYEMTPLETDTITHDGMTFKSGKVKTFHHPTQETTYYCYIVTTLAKHKVRCYVQRVDESISLAQFRQDRSLEIKDIIVPFVMNQGFTLRDIPHEQRTAILSIILKDKEDQFQSVFQQFYNDNTDLLDTITESGLKLPNVLKALSEFVLTNRFTNAFSHLIKDCDFHKCSSAYLLLNEAKKYGLTIDQTEAMKTMQELIMLHLIKVEQVCNEENCAKMIDILSFSRSLNFYYENGGKIINRIWRIMNKVGKPLIASLKDPVADYPQYIIACRIIEIAEKVNFSAQELKDMLKEFEGKLAGNPRERFS